MKDIINKEKNQEKLNMTNVQQNINKMSDNKNKLNNLLTIKTLKPIHVQQNKNKSKNRNKYKYILPKNIIINLLSVFYKSKKRKNMNIIISKNKAHINKIFKNNKHKNKKIINNQSVSKKITKK